MSKKLLGAALIASLAVAGCSTLSQVDHDGYTDEPVFPELDDVKFKTGTYPNLDNLRQIGDGMTRDQLYDLVGLTPQRWIVGSYGSKA